MNQQDAGCKQRLIRTVSTAKRCYECNKMIFINIFHCRTCNINLHESCSDNHTCIFYKAAEEMKSYFRKDNTTTSISSSKSPAASKASKPGHSMIYSKFVRWLSSHTQRRNSRKEHKTSDEKHVKGKFGLSNSDAKSHGKRSSTKSRLVSLLRNASSNSSTAGANVFPENCAQVQRISSCNCNETGINSICCECGFLRGYPHKTPSDVHTNSNSFSSGVVTDFFSSSGYTSTASSLNRTPSSEQHEANKLYQHQMKSYNQRFSPTVLSPDPNKSNRDSTEFPFNNECVRISSGAKARTLSLDKKEQRNELLSATWPPNGMKSFEFDKIPEQGEHFYECDNLNPEEFLNDSFLEDWSIPFEDLNNLQKLKHGRIGSIYRGSWHGDVLIHSFNIKGKAQLKDLEGFMEDVAKLSKIRHENFNLFMGISLCPNQAIISSCSRKALSVYEHVHLKRGKLALALSMKVKMARELCQGMSYLHAKEIVHKKLTSKNIFLEESSVKISMLDNSMVQQDHERPDYGCLPQGHLTYISCEMMRSLTVSPPHIQQNIKYSNATDIFAFGSVLHELFAECWPFSGHNSHSIIWKVASGKTSDLSLIKCHKIKDIMSKCWSFEPEKRPQFSEILKSLPVILDKKKSYSQPGGLDTCGLSPDNGKWMGKLNQL